MRDVRMSIGDGEVSKEALVSGRDVEVDHARERPNYCSKSPDLMVYNV